MKRTSLMLGIVVCFFMLGIQAWAQPQTHPFCGIVTTPNGSSNVGIPNASVLLNPPPPSGPNPIMTDANGEFCTNLTPGTYSVTVSVDTCDGYQTDLVMPDTNKYVVFSLQCPPIDPPEDSTFTFCGTVTAIDMPGPPLDSVLVEILIPNTSIVLYYKYTYPTGDSAYPTGKFCFYGVPYGTYQVRFSRPGYQTLVMDLILHNDKFVVISILPAPLE